MKRSWLHAMILLALAHPQALAGDEQVPDLKSYPQSDKIWIGSYSGLVEVNPKLDLESVRFGDLHWVVDDGATVKAGDVTAYCSYAKVLHSNAQLKKAADEYKINLRTAKWDHIKETEGLEQDAAAIETEISRFSFSDSERELAGPKLSAKVDKHLEKLKAKLNVAREQLEPAMRDEQLRLKLEQLELEMQGKYIENKDLVNSLAVHAPHDGVVHQLKTGEVQIGDVIGKLERKGRAVLMVQMIDAEVLRENPESLEVMARDSRGMPLKGTYSGIYEKKNSAVGPQVYMFDLIPDGDFELSGDTTGERMVSIYRRLDGVASIIPKTKFLFENTEEVQKLGWNKFIEARWPNAEIVYIGPNSIAVARTP